MHALVCQNCGKAFESRKQGQKYCNRECYHQAARTLPDKVCPQCHQTFRPASHRQFLCGLKCSLPWIAKHRKTSRGQYKTTKGYILLYRPEHPRAAKSGYIMEHRLIMEQELERPLLPSEVVHHKNGVKDDNRLENLEVMSKRKHDVARSPIYYATCPHCGKDFPIRGNAYTVAQHE